ncbi:hypothetical protein LJC47_05825, partial [Desulfosarcina sp. OttesenSCG-928-B08]|nr:hypothetical protein [Desulfosarcina sp. OttesenSCG-928-B08]
YSDLIIRIKETGETLTVLNGASTNTYYQIKSVGFRDGTTWSWNDVKQFGINGTQEGDTLQLTQAGGSGEGDAVRLATLDQAPALTAEDFIVGVALPTDGFFKTVFRK